jgi:hypothetical protein
VAQTLSVDVDRLEEFVARSARHRRQLTATLADLAISGARLADRFASPTLGSSWLPRRDQLDARLGETDAAVAAVAASLRSGQGLVACPPTWELAPIDPGPASPLVAGPQAVSTDGPGADTASWRGRAEHLVGRQVFNPDGWVRVAETTIDGALAIDSIRPGSPGFNHLLLRDPQELADRSWSSALGAADWARDTATVGYAASTLLVSSPSFVRELARVRQDPTDHAGLALTTGIVEVGLGFDSFSPLSPAMYRELAEVRATGTVANHDGLNHAGSVAASLLDWETFELDPNRWAGRIAPEMALDMMTGGAAAAGGGPVLRFVDDVVAPSRADDVLDLDGVVWNDFGEPRYESVDVRSTLDPADASAVRAYTGHASYELNHALRNGVEPGSVLDTQARQVDAALDALPRHTQGPLYRSTDLPASVVEDLADGGLFVDQGFLSTSSVQSEAASFGGEHLLVIEDSASGRVFGNSSEFRFESEVVFPRGTQFEVLRVVDDGGRLTVHLVERGRP